VVFKQLRLSGAFPQLRSVLAMGNRAANCITTSEGPVCERARAKIVGNNRTQSELEGHAINARTSLLLTVGQLQRKVYHDLQIQFYRIRQAPVSDHDPLRLHSLVSLKVSESEYMRIEWYEDGLLLQPVQATKQVTLESEKCKDFLTRLELLVHTSEGVVVGTAAALSAKAVLGTKTALGVKVVAAAIGGCKVAAATAATVVNPRAAVVVAASAGVCGAVAGGAYLLDRKTKWRPVREPETALVRIREALIAMEEDEQRKRNKYDPVHWNCGHFANYLAEVLSS